MQLPDHHQTVMPYLIVEGAAGLMAFLQEVFQAEVLNHYPREEEPGKIMHAELKIGQSVIMIADATADWSPSPAGMFIYVPDTDQAYEAALARKATSLMPVEDKDYGRTSGVRDAWGNAWWITSLG